MWVSSTVTTFIYISAVLALIVVVRWVPSLIFLVILFLSLTLSLSSSFAICEHTSPISGRTVLCNFVPFFQVCSAMPSHAEHSNQLLLSISSCSCPLCQPYYPRKNRTSGSAPAWNRLNACVTGADRTAPVTTWPKVGSPCICTLIFFHVFFPMMIDKAKSENKNKFDCFDRTTI